MIVNQFVEKFHLTLEITQINPYFRPGIVRLVSRTSPQRRRVEVEIPQRWLREWLGLAYPIMPAVAPMDMLSDRTVLSRPSIELVMCLLHFRLEVSSDTNIIPRLAAALAACAQLSYLGKNFFFILAKFPP